MSRRRRPARTLNNWEKNEGSSAPLGVSWIEEHQGYNFALYSRYATGVTLLLYTAQDPLEPVAQIRFDPQRNKSGRVWHAWVPGASASGAVYYAYRVEGPTDHRAGHRFDPQKILVDPFAAAVFFPPAYDRKAVARPGPTDGRAPLGVLPQQHTPFDWSNDRRPRHAHDTIVYEMHVKGFTAHPNSGVRPDHRGTFAGIIDKIPYLQELGVTVVELLPIHQYDPQEGNYWGYMTLNFFSPHEGYANGDALAEFRDMVRALHAAGIEVWLDVVYNHTSEGDAEGPIYSYRGIDNRSYYLLSPDLRFYRNETGTGNTLRCAHPVVRELIMESLHFWAEETRVDGFRFDLASIFTRRADGTLDLDDPSTVAEISSLGHYYNVRLIAEAWDIGTYQLGRSFPGTAWMQWNGKYRDDLRAFVRGDRGKVGDLMQRLYGSDDLFPDGLSDTYRPFQSVNYVTSHDGFCLYDLVAYNEKHNEANGHHNTDGTNDNLSWNCGWEGDFDAPPAVMALRRQQIKNFCCLLLLSNGTPMFVAGDEFMNTQGGNNNPYNQDNATTWLDWDLLERHHDIFRFFKQMIAFRKAHPTIGRSRYWRSDVRWYGLGPRVDLAHHARHLAFCLHGAGWDDDDLYVMVNAHWQDLTFTIQEGKAKEWLRVVDTALPSPQDIAEPGHEVRLSRLDVLVRARSVVVLRRPNTPSNPR